MCQRGRWRGFHSRYLKTPKGQESPLVIMEQCTECNSYRARNAEGIAYVVPDEQQEEARQESETLPDPDSGSNDGSVWGPSSGANSSDSDSW